MRKPAFLLRRRCFHDNFTVDVALPRVKGGMEYSQDSFKMFKRGGDRLSSSDVYKSTSLLLMHLRNSASLLSSYKSTTDYLLTQLSPQTFLLNLRL
jgi:hypothetical protein